MTHVPTELLSEPCVVRTPKWIRMQMASTCSRDDYIPSPQPLGDGIFRRMLHGKASIRFLTKRPQSSYRYLQFVDGEPCFNITGDASGPRLWVPLARDQEQSGYPGRNLHIERSHLVLHSSASQMSSRREARTCLSSGQTSYPSVVANC